MNENRYQSTFQRLDAENRGAFIPFLVVGDPDPNAFIEAAQALIDGGADALELGIPFSDPVADGPVIQEAVIRALTAGTTPDKCFELIRTLRQRNRDIPIGILTYANAVFQRSFDDYFAAVQDAGIDSVLTADLPVFEADSYVQAAARHGICTVFIAPPNATELELQQIAAASKGYTYVVARSGVTGCDSELVLSFKETIDALHRLGAPRPVVGFGISEPRHVAQVIDAGAAGAISGSKVVQLLAQARKDGASIHGALSRFVGEMKRATTRVVCSGK
jgi:tryptophan synthase alpha chain